MSRPAVELDHGAYLTTRRYRRATHAAILRMPKGSVSIMTILHEHDRSCCALEPWSVTYTRVIANLNADGHRTLGVQLTTPSPAPAGSTTAATR